MAHIRQSRSDSGLGFQVKALRPRPDDEATTKQVLSSYTSMLGDI